MKRFSAISLSALFILLFSIQGHTADRSNWWEIRLNTLKKDKQALKNKAWYPIIGQLIDKEIESAENALDVFESYKRGYGELGETTQIYNDQSIENISEKKIKAVFSIYYLNTYLRNPDFQTWYKLGNKILRDKTTKQVNKDFPEADDIFISNFLNSNSLNHHSKYFANEIYLNHLINNFDNSYINVKKDILTMINSEFSNYDYKLKKYKAHSIVDDIIYEYFSTYNYNYNINDFSNQEYESWVWENINYFNENKLDSYKQAKELLEYNPAASKTVLKLDYYYNRPSDLEKIAFKAIFNALLNTEKYKKPERIHAADFVFPQEPSLKNLYREMDFIRQRYFAEITGNETNNYFQTIEKDYKALIIKYMKYSGAYFAAETKKLENINTAAGNTEFRKEFISEHQSFFDSRNIYYRKYNASTKYAEKCINFLRWYSGVKGHDPKKINTLLNNRIQINKQYINFILSLETNILPASEISSYNYYNNLSSIGTLTSNMIKSISYSLSIDNSFRAFLTKNEIKEYNKNISDFSTYTLSTKKEIYTNHSNFRKKYISIIKERESNSERMKKRIAQYEINIISENINRYLSVLKTLNYSDEVFRDYTEKFKKIKKDTSAGIFTKELDTVMKSGSFFSTIDNYDSQRLQNEYLAKQYIRKVISRDVAGIKTLSSNYKKKGVDLIDLPVYLNEQSISNSLYHKSQTKIYTWAMHEKNYRETDRKAVKLIKDIYYKKSWELTPDNRSEGIETAESPHKKYRLKNSNIMFMVPTGWDQVQPTETELSMNCISKFVNGENYSEINIVFYDNIESEPQAVNKWISANREKPVRIGWDTVNGKEYYWIISKDDANNVIKTYAVKTDYGMVLISGKTDKKRFPFFQGRIESVFKSIADGV